MLSKKKYSKQKRIKQLPQLQINDRNKASDVMTPIYLKETDSLINIESLDVDHPLWDTNYVRNYDVNNFDEMLKMSIVYRDSISLIIRSFKNEMDKRRCLDLNTRTKIAAALDSVVRYHDMYVKWSQECEFISYRNGKSAGRNSLDLKLFLYRRFLNYLKHLTNTLFSVYLDAAVLNCSQ